MTADETELTFVRCPGCRSLVPAVATRCRMCGFLLQEGAGPVAGGSEPSGAAPSDIQQSPSKPESTSADTADTKGKSRVRQKTISVSGTEFGNLRTQFGLSAEGAEPVGEEDRNEEAGIEPDIFEPSAKQVSAEEPPVKSSRVEAPRSEEHRGLNFGDKTSSMQNPVPAVQLEEAEGEHEDEGDFEGDDSEEMEGQYGSSSGNLAEDGQPMSSSKKRRRRRKKKKQGGEQGFSPEGTRENFQRREDSSPAPQPSFQQRAPQQQSVSSQTAPERHMPEHSTIEEPRQAVSQQHSSERERIGGREVETAQYPAGSRGDLGNRGDAQNRGETSRQASELKPVGDGGLVGWFVSFDNSPRGTAREVREGRFFLGSERVRGTDLVVVNSSISTPHCLIHASADKGIRVQDLMSEHGTYLMRQGESAYTRYHEPITVEHGDWIKFGEYEVLVCVMPQAKRAS